MKEKFQGLVWEGMVEVFRLFGHLKAVHVYAWARAHETGEDKKRYVTVLQIESIISAREAVRAAIAQEFRGLNHPSNKGKGLEPQDPKGANARIVPVRLTAEDLRAMEVRVKACADSCDCDQSS